MAEKNYWIHIKQGDFELDVEGDRNFVESYVKTFLEEETPKGRSGRATKAKPAVKKAGRKPSRAAKKAVKAATQAGKKAKTAKAAEKASAVPEITKEELKKFLKGRSTKSLRDRYLLYSQFWASKGVKEISNNHIVACSKAAGHSDTGSGRQYFSIFTGQGLMKRGSKRGLWVLTPAGLAEKETGRGNVKANPAPKTKKKAKAASKAKPAKKTVKEAGSKAKPKTKAKAKPKAKAKAKAKAVKKPAKKTPTGKKRTSGKRKPPKSLDEVMGPA